MPAYAYNFTPVYKLLYLCGSLQHHIQFRGGRGQSSAIVVANAQNTLNAVFDALKSGLPDDLAFISATYQQEDTDFTIPAAVPTAVTGAVTIASLQKVDKIGHLTFTGRTTGGNPWSAKVFGWVVNLDVSGSAVQDFRFDPSDNAAIDAGRAAWAASGQLRGADNNSVTLHGTVKWKVNDFWLKKVRKGQA